MKKIFLIITLFLVLLPFMALAADPAEPIVPCGNGSTVGEKCTLDSLKLMPLRVITWIKDNLILPLAILLITIGGLVMIFSGGSPNLMALGKKIIFTTLIGGLLAYGAAAIIGAILTALVYTGPLP